MNLKLIIPAVAVVTFLSVGGYFLFSKAEQGSDQLASQFSPLAGGALESQKQQVQKAPWSIRCNDAEAVKAENRRGRCEMVQSLFVAETGQKLIEFALGHPSDTEAMRGVLQLPLGILIAEGVQIQVDENQPFKAEVRYCKPEGCYSYLSMPQPVLDLMVQGENLKISMTTGAGKKVNVVMSLKDFNKALEYIT